MSTWAWLGTCLGWIVEFVPFAIITRKLMIANGEKNAGYYSDVYAEVTVYSWFLFIIPAIPITIMIMMVFYALGWEDGVNDWAVPIGKTGGFTVAQYFIWRHMLKKRLVKRSDTVVKPPPLFAPGQISPADSAPKSDG